MAITTAMSTSFKVELMTKQHDLTAAADAIKMALFTSSANLDATTTVFNATNEVSGTGYTTGGLTLTNVTPTSSGTVAFADFNVAVWSTATITARGAHIYNSTSGNKSISTHDFGSDKSSSAADFTVQFPTADSSNAILRLA